MIEEILKKESSWELLKRTDLPIVLYGTGDGADKVVDELLHLDIKLSGIMASDGFVRSRSFRGFEVKRAADFEEEFGDFIIAIGFGTCLTDVIENIVSLSKRHKVIVPCVPVYDSVIFNREFIESNRERLERVYEALADDISKRVFYDFLLFELTGELEYLFRSETTKDEAFNNILKLTESESYLDLGAFKGDTIDEFLHYTNEQYREILALEPNKKSFDKLSIKLSSLKNSECKNLGIWSTSGTLTFSGDGRNNSVSSSGKEISVSTVDELCKDRLVSYIKADVEGCENEMLEKSIETLSQKKPKLNIAAYHKSEDIFSIPLKILELNSDYKIFLRHHKYIPCWDLNYYCV